MDVITIAGFPITHDVPLKKRGTHVDVWYEILNHGRLKFGYDTQMEPSGGTWCYYVVVSELMLPAEQFAEFWLAPSAHDTRSNGISYPNYDYCSAPFADVDWHGGVTFYEKLGGIDGMPRSVKIGCDFAHLWDQGREFNYEIVEIEAKRTIDQLRAMYPFYRKCCYSGRWQPESEMIEKDGKLWSKEGLDSAERYKSEYATQ